MGNEVLGIGPEARQFAAVPGAATPTASYFPPCSEAAFAALAAGAAMCGQQIFAHLGLAPFSYPAFSSIANEIAPARLSSGGKIKVPVTLHISHGLLHGGGAQHTESPLSTVLEPARHRDRRRPGVPRDVKGLLRTAIKSENPTIVITHAFGYGAEDDVPDDDYEIPFGEAAVAREGSDVTIVACSMMVVAALQAAEQLAADGIEAEVVDLRTLRPARRAAILESVSQDRSPGGRRRGPPALWRGLRDRRHRERAGLRLAQGAAGPRGPDGRTGRGQPGPGGLHLAVGGEARGGGEAGRGAGARMNVELANAYWTSAGPVEVHAGREWSLYDFGDRCAAAARAGFRGIGLWHADIVHVLERRTLRECKQLLDDNGLEHLELEFLMDWFLDEDDPAGRAANGTRELLFDGGRGTGRPSHQGREHSGHRLRAPAAHRALCRAVRGRRRAHVGEVLYEFMPFDVNVHSIETALQVVEGVDNSGVVIDTWHMAKLGIAPDDLRKIPLAQLGWVELSDGQVEDMPDRVDETVNHRKLPGEGEFDIRGYVEVCLDMGYDEAWGVEVLSEDLRGHPIDEMFQRTFRAAAAQFEPVAA